MCLAQLAGALPCDCMPGGTDPANHALPQQPLHPCLLPGAVSFPTFNRYVCCIVTTVTLPPFLDIMSSVLCRSLFQHAQCIR